MAESDYVCHAILVADMQASEEYHMNTSNGFHPPSISASSKYTGDYGWYMLGRRDGLGTKGLPSIAKTIRVGFWFRWEGWLPSSQFLLYMMSSDYDHETLRIWLNEDNYSIEVMQYNSLSEELEVIYRSFDLNIILSGADEWRHIGIFLNVEDGVLALYANGKMVIYIADIDIGQPNNLFVGKSSTSGNYDSIDDIYVEYSPYVESNLAPPAKRFYPSLPNGIGSADDWTPQGAADNYACVDEATVPDNDITYVLANTNTLLDMYQFASLAALPLNEVPKAALIQAYCALTSGRSGGWGSLVFAFRGTMNAAYGNKRSIVYTWPDSNEWAVIVDRMASLPQGGAWTESEFNGGEFGYESADLI